MLGNKGKRSRKEMAVLLMLTGKKEEGCSDQKKKVKTSNSGGYYTLKDIGKCFRDDISKSINQTLYYESSVILFQPSDQQPWVLDQSDCSVG
jgi:hypothetical protein